MRAYRPIREYLAAVRRRLRQNAALEVALLAATALALLVLVVPLIALQVALHHGSTIFFVTVAGTCLLLLVLGLVGLVRPARRYRDDLQVARFVGDARADIASDLVSAVEFAATPSSSGRGSRELIAAFLDSTASRLDAVRPAALVSTRALQRSAISCAAAVSCLSAAILLSPATVRAGWERVLDPTDPRPFGGARMSATPLVGDIEVTVEYPEYTGRPPLTLPSSSGDVRAMPGSFLTVRTRSLMPLLSARIVLEDEGTPTASDDSQEGEQAVAGSAEPPATAAKATEIAFEVGDQERLSARFPVQRPARYRILIEGMDRQKHVEATTRRIEMEFDRRPDVQLYTPGDDLDVASLKRIELAYVAEDDYGISLVSLVYTEGDHTQEKKLAKLPDGRRTAQAKFLWDLAELALEPGSQVSYHLQVTDNNTVTGPRVGRSRAFRLRVFSPREKHEALVDRQGELLERMLHALAGRLTVSVGDLHAHEALQREAADLVVELGTLVAALRDDELADGALRETLDGMRSRIDKLTKAEATIISKLRAKQEQRQPQIGARLKAPAAAMVAELESSAIVLSNWLERQQMENLLALTDEVEVHQQRLRQLFKEYQRTGAADLLAEIERELRSLETRMAEMTQQRAQVAADVLDRFVNSDAMPEERVTDCMSEVRSLMAAGHTLEAEQLMASCMGSLDHASEALEQALRDLRGDTFSDQERHFGEVMDRLADLSLEQGEIAESAQRVWDRYAARAEEMMREEAKDTRRRVSRLQERLQRGLDDVPESGLTPFAKEELDIVDTRLANVDEMLADGDIAEALAMAELARASVETAASELEAAVVDEQGEPWSENTVEARRDLGRVQPLMDKLVADLAASTPAPGDIMSRRDRRELDRLGRRQQSVAERSRRLADRAEKLAEGLPGRSGEALARGVANARAHMERSNLRMRSRDPSGARQESQSAAEALWRTVELTRDAARGRHGLVRTGLRDEPVRIPGADQYKAPQEFRADILDAMKREQAPRGFGNLVKRYYQELIR